MTDTRKAGQRKKQERRPQSKQTEGQKGKLTDKQELFCREYIIDLNGTQSAIRAGYSPKGADVAAQTLLGNIRIRQRIAELQKSRSVRTRITQDYVLENLQEILERCMQRAPVMARGPDGWEQAKDAQGNHLWEFDARNALGAIKQMGDHLGLYTQNVRLTGADGGPLKTENTNVNADVTLEDLQGKSAAELAQLYFKK